MYLTYCAICHGEDGKLREEIGTRVSLKGLQVSPIIRASVGYYYERMKRGGTRMLVIKLPSL